MSIDLVQHWADIDPHVPFHSSFTLVTLSPENSEFPVVLKGGYAP